MTQTGQSHVLPGVVFQSLRDIQPGEELTIPLFVGEGIVSIPFTP
jgi:hypothetical protein